MGQAYGQAEPFTTEINLVDGTDGWPTEDSPILSFVDGTAKKKGLTFTGFRRKFQSLQVHCMGKYTPDAPILTMAAFRKYQDQNLCVEVRMEYYYVKCLF